MKIDPSSWVEGVILEGYKIPFEKVPIQVDTPVNPLATGEVFDILENEAHDLLIKSSIEKVDHEPGEYISTYFAVAKARSPGKFRPILNLKRFNRNIKKFKFRMETLAHVRDWIREGAFCVSIDLKDAFLHVPIAKRFRKYLRFKWRKILYQWIVLPFGLRCSPRVLTKVLKPVMAFLRTKFGMLISIYLDDMLIQASSREKALLHGQIAALVLMVLGWSVNFKKSTFVPSQKVVHLGFELDTVAMLVSCPLPKIKDLQNLARAARESGSLTVHECERLLGKMESVRPATPQAALHYRALQNQLLRAKSSWGEDERFPRQMLLLSEDSKLCLDWWISPAGFEGNSTSQMHELALTLELWADANLEMCGAYNS